MTERKPRKPTMPGIPERDEVNNPIGPANENDAPVEEPPDERRRRDDKEDKEEHLI